MIGGLHEWRNIQGVVRQTFKALHDVIKSQVSYSIEYTLIGFELQGEKIKRLEYALDTKASMVTLQSLEISMANKPTFGEVEKMLDGITYRNNQSVAEISGKIKRKADKADLKELYDGLNIITA